MKRKLSKYITEIRKVKDPQAQRTHLIVVTRMLLQHACVSMIEWLAETKLPNGERGFLDLGEISDRLRRPSDGDLVSCVGELVVAVRRHGANVCPGYWQKVPNEEVCRHFCKQKQATFADVLGGWVSMRNQGAEGHGLPGGFDQESEMAFAEMSISLLEDVLPTIEADGRLICTIAGKRCVLRLLQIIDGNPMLYRSIEPKAGDVCQVSYQLRTAIHEREDGRFEARDVLGQGARVKIIRYEERQTNADAWLPLSSAPERLTNDFVGRSQELQALAAWADDKDSRVCIVYGDGGNGKTTLAIEFLHRWLEGKLGIEWRPTVISFYSAKQTRWGLEGLERIRGAQVGMANALQDMALNFGDSLSNDWYKKDAKALATQLNGLLGVARDDHLVVLDNTETMAESQEDVKVLGRDIRELSRHVGRVIVTSRRFEQIEALPIELPRLSEDEAESFLRKKGKALKKKAIEQAGSASLKRVALVLDYKPLLLDALVYAIHSDSVGLQEALDRVTRLAAGDLGEFLYQDAWGRLTPRLQHLLLLMSRTGDVHDGALLRMCCFEADVSVTEAESALAESRGIASVLSHAIGGQDYRLEPSFQRFCSQRTVTIQGQELPSELVVTRIKRQYTQALKATRGEYRDRVQKAFVHPDARAAKQAFSEGRNNDAATFLERALIADSKNVDLLERAGYFLAMKMGKLPEGLSRVDRALQLEPTHGEAHFSRGVILGRMGRTPEALEALGRAEKHGIEKYRCDLQRAHAQLRDTPPNTSMARKHIEETEAALDKAGTYNPKSLDEIEKLRSRIRLIEQEALR